MKYMNKTLMLMAAALMAFSACDKWTETEPVNVIYETLESKNPDLYAQDLHSLRDYHASAHQVLIAKFDNKADVAIRALCAARKADSRVKVLITGHTDNVGSAESNMNYGKKRAEALKQLMVKLGAPASSIATASRGQEEPVVDNDTDEHRHQNRRAVITLR